MKNEERIRQRAHELWESEGRPEGRHIAHWEQACQECENEDAHGGNVTAETNVGNLTDGAIELQRTNQYGTEGQEEDTERKNQETIEAAAVSASS